MKPIAVLLKDTHLQESNIQTNRSVYKQTIDFCVDNGIKKIIHIGDVFNSRKSQPQIILTAFEEILDEIQENGLEMISIVGNHDKTDYDAKESFLSPFKHHPAFELIEIGGVLRVENTLCAFLSYFSDAIYIEHLENVVFQLNELYGDEKCSLFTHIGVNGAVMNNGTKIESGIKTSMFKRFERVNIGHYHDGQSWGNIHYLGASIQHNYGERTTKGFDVLYDNHTTELITLEFPMYKKYEVDVNELTQQDLDDLKAEKEETNDFIKIVLVGEEKDVKAYNIQKLKQVGVEVALKMPEIEISELQTRIEPFTITTLQDQFNEFCDENKLDKEQGLKYFQKIAQNV